MILPPSYAEQKVLSKKLQPHELMCVWDIHCVCCIGLLCVRIGGFYVMECRRLEINLNS